MERITKTYYMAALAIIDTLITTYKFYAIFRHNKKYNYFLLILNGALTSIQSYFVRDFIQILSIFVYFNSFLDKKNTTFSLTFKVKF